MAKWIEIVSYGREYMINLDNIDSIQCNNAGRAILEWGNGNCQLMLERPTYKEIKRELEEANQSSK